jgi:quinol-cytochrome oxidoreductase complex cytochrome b subunit
MGEKKRKEERSEKFKPEFVFHRKNYKFMAIGIFFIVLGFILMAGGGSDDPNVFNPAIYNWQRIRLAPALVLLGFGIEVYAILLKPDSKEEN